MIDVSTCSGAGSTGNAPRQRGKIEHETYENLGPAFQILTSEVSSAAFLLAGVPEVVEVDAIIVML